MIRTVLALMGCVYLAAVGIAAQSSGVKIVVISGEDGVNIIGKGTAVAPVVEVRDQNDLPVAGASVVFLIGGGGARFANNATSVTVATDAGGRATATGIKAIGKGVVRIQVQASYQGETATATVTQTNFAGVAEAAQAGKSVTNPQGGANGASQGAAQGSHHIGLIAGAAVAVGGLVTAKSLGVLGGRTLCNTQNDEMFAAGEVYGQCFDLASRPGSCSAEIQALRSAIDRFCACEGSPSDSATAVNQGGWITLCRNGS